MLLDELNLAGQSVLEGLNGLLDHRAALFVPELGQSFKAHPQFRWGVCVGGSLVGETCGAALGSCLTARSLLCQSSSALH